MTSPELLLNLVAGWMLTYWLHSTLWIGATWLSFRLVTINRAKVRQLLWRAALLAPLLTATIHSVGIVSPVGGGFTLQGTTAARPAPPEGEMALASQLPKIATAENHQTLPTAAPLNTGKTGAELPSFWLIALAVFWSGGTSLALIRWFTAARNLRDLMADRRPVHGGGYLHRLARRMGIRRPVSLSLSDAIPVPFACGLRRPEICLPSHLTSELTTRSSQALVAHEMAHLARRDPAWQAGYRLIEGVLFFQPLNRIARHRLEHEAELLADDQAAMSTGNPIELAHCLVDVATRLAARPHVAPMPAALGRTTRIEERVTRLLSKKMSNHPQSRCAIALLLGAVAVMIFAVPNVSLTCAEAARLDGVAVAPVHEIIAPPAPARLSAAPASAAEPAPAPPPKAPPIETSSAPPAPAAQPVEPVPAPEPPSAWTIEQNEVLKKLQACEQELKRLSEELGPEATDELARIRSELERLHIEESLVRRRSAEIAREREVHGEEQREASRARAEEMRQMREQQIRAKREQAREVARMRAEAEKSSREERDELEARIREFVIQKAELERQEAERAQQLEAEMELELEHKLQEEKLRLMEKSREQQPDDPNDG